MGAFNAEHIIFQHTLVASAALSAGDPVTAAGAKASGPDNFVGIAAADAANGEAVPVVSLGVVSVLADSGGNGVAVGDRVTYVTDGYDTTTGFGFGIALDAAAASGQFRMLLVGGGAAAKAAALTAADGGTVDATYGQPEADVIANNVVRIGEIEAALQAAGLLT